MIDSAVLLTNTSCDYSSLLLTAFLQISDLIFNFLIALWSEKILYVII